MGSVTTNRVIGCLAHTQTLILVALGKHEIGRLRICPGSILKQGKSKELFNEASLTLSCWSHMKGHIHRLQLDPLV